MSETKQRKKERCLVVGGCGFLGRHLAEQLLARAYAVSIFDIRQTFENPQMKFFIGDLCDESALTPALTDVQIIFHCASPSPASNNKKLFYAVNVNGTKSLIATAKKNNIHRFVLTSSASVVFEGTDIEDGDENLPYAARPIDYYTETKILQEKEVLDSNSKDFHTVAIRPHGIFGPSDLLMVPTVAATAKAGKMKFRIGNGENIVDFTYVLNVVHGHILAAEHLGPGSAVCGQAYNITNCEPIKFWDFMSSMCTGLGYNPPKFNTPFWLVYYLSVLVQFLVWLLSPLVKIESTFTPMRIALAGTHHYYSPKKAQRDLEYKPLFSVAEGLKTTLEAYPHLRNKSTTYNPSK